MSKNQIRLEMTCGACPEQYDAYLGEHVVGYLRLRYGYFSVAGGGPGGPLLYWAYPQGDGVFDEAERDYYLDIARRAVLSWVEAGKPFEPTWAFVVAQLRHAYAQLYAGEVQDQRGFAVGLIGPMIEHLERRTIERKRDECAHEKRDLYYAPDGHYTVCKSCGDVDE